MDVESECGPFSQRDCWIGGHTGEIAAAVGVSWSYVQVAPGRHSFPVWKHFLLDEEKKIQEGKEKCHKGRDGKT